MNNTNVNRNFVIAKRKLLDKFNKNGTLVVIGHRGWYAILSSYQFKFIKHLIKVAEMPRTRTNSAIRRILTYDYEEVKRALAVEEIINTVDEPTLRHKNTINKKPEEESLDKLLNKLLFVRNEYPKCFDRNGIIITKEQTGGKWDGCKREQELTRAEDEIIMHKRVQDELCENPYAYAHKF